MQGKSNITGFLICENVLKIKKKQLTTTTAYDMIFKLLSESSVAKNKIKKLLTKTTDCGNINELSMRQQQRTLKTEQYVKPCKF